MRPYPANSPQAAGRILGLLLIADGHVCSSEIEALNRLEAERHVGLPPGGMAIVLRDLCEDLLAASSYTGSMLEALDGSTLRAIMAEVSDPRLRSEVLTLAQAAAGADAHLSEGEAFVLGAACRYWSLAPPNVAAAAVPA